MKKLILLSLITLSAGVLLQAQDCLAPVKTDKLWGIIDLQGTFVIEPRFANAQPFSEGLAAVRTGSLWGYINASGEMVIAETFIRAEPFSEGLARVRPDDKKMICGGI